MFGWGKGRKAAKVTPVTLQEQIDALEGQFRGLKLEWTDTYERLYKIAGRMDAARRWGAEKAQGEGPGKPENVAQRGTEELIAPPNNGDPPPSPKMSRSELLQSLTR